MKKIIIGLIISLSCITDVFANEVIHGIDIDYVYNTSDWSNKEKIKDIISDYASLLQYKKQLRQCSQTIEQTDCLNTLAEDIIKQFYNYNLENNLNSYHNYIKTLYSAYGIIYCSNKYKIPAGTMCSQETTGKIWEMIERYISDLLHMVEQPLNDYSFLSDYKD